MGTLEKRETFRRLLASRPALPESAALAFHL